MSRRLLSHGSLWVGIAALVFLWVITLQSTVAMAQAQSADPATAGVTPNDINEVARELWCPLCSGVRLDACELKACDQMKDVIAVKLAEGADTAAIKDYFVEQYGPQVLGEPPREGFNWLAWILPVVVLVGGGVFVWRRAQQMVRPTQAAGAGGPARNSAEADEYAAKLEEELARHG